MSDKDANRNKRLQGENMNLGLKAVQLLNAQTEQEVDEAIKLFTDKQKDMLLKVLLKYYHGEETTPEELLETINQA